MSTRTHKAKTLSGHWVSIALLLIPYCMSAQGGFQIASGTQVVCSGNPSIVITDGRWLNDGTFSAATSLVRLEGTASTANSTIGGTSTTSFYHLTQQKTANDIRLNQNIEVDGDFTMSGGLFQLNNFNVTLGTATGQVVGETETNRITGTTGGEIIKVMSLNAPAGVNPGNLGAMFTSAANLGSTTVERGHVQQTDGNSGISIYRYYDIVVSNNTGLAATLRLHYFDAELGTLVESQLEHFNSLNSGFSWYGRGFTARDVTNDWVQNPNYNDLASRWTLASPIVQPLPVEFLNEGIRCESDAAVMFWTVMERPGSDYFQVEKSEDEVTWTALPDGRIASKGAGHHRYEYMLSESAAFYRVLQADVDGSTTMSENHRLTCNVAGAWTIWPNPVTDQLHVKAPFGKAIAAVEVVNMLGQVVLHHDISATDVPEFSLDLAHRLPAAMYTLKVFPTTGNMIVKKFEVGR